MFTLIRSLLCAVLLTQIVQTQFATSEDTDQTVLMRSLISLCWLLMPKWALFFFTLLRCHCVQQGIRSQINHIL